MASNEYIIRIFYDTPDGSSVGTAPTVPSAASQGGNDAKSKPTPSVSAASAVSSMISTGLNTGLTMEAQKINTITGSGQLAQKQALVNSVARSTVNAITSAIGGAGVAASLGLASGPVGAAVGLAISAVSKILDIATSMADISNQKLVEGAAINATKARATISWDRSRER